MANNSALNTVILMDNFHFAGDCHSSRNGQFWGWIIKSIYNLVSHCLPCNSSHNVVNHAIDIMEAFSNVNIVAKLLAKLQEVQIGKSTHFRNIYISVDTVEFVI